MVDDDPYLLLRAVAMLRNGPRPLELASACEDAAAALDRSRGTEAARQLLATARAAYETLGAVRETARLDARLRAAGVRRGTRGRRKRPETGWGALTPTERQVVDLVAEGMSNPEIARRLFLSRHTVQTHVSHALAKLGLRSRVELAAEVVRNRAT
jgi:DNA-binding CsgD family transcriptional regulator